MKKQLLLLVMTLLPMVANAYDIIADIAGIIYYLDVENKVACVGKKQDKYSGEVNIPESVTFNSVTYSVTGIGSSAFYGCTGLTSITIPNSVTSIGNDAFSGCGGLTSVTIPNSVTSIGGGAFYNTGWYNNQPDGILYLDNCLIGYKGEKPTGKVTTEDGTRLIAAGAFFGCSGLTSITIPNSVTSIGLAAFQSCSGLTSITIPNSVTSIGDDAFNSCSGLTSIVVESGNPVYDSRGGCNAIIKTSEHKLLTGCMNTTIPNSVTSIGNRAFSYCSGLTSVTIPNSVTSIDDQAFSGCSGLTSVTVNIAEPLTISSLTFNNSYKATLYVPTGSKTKYAAANYWKNFTLIMEITEKCATPTIKHIGGKLKFECETEGVTFISYFSMPAGSNNNTSEVSVPTTYTVNVYAKKDGYLNSDVAAENIDVRGIQGDVNLDGKVTITDAVSVVNIILNNGEATAPALQDEEEMKEPE